MPKDLYPKLCRPETLKIAANYVLDDQKDDFVPDVFRHQDYIYNLNENPTRLARNLAHGTYRPRQLREIDVPKSGISVRPGSSLDFEDHIVFFGISALRRRKGGFRPPQNFHYLKRNESPLLASLAIPQNN